MTATAPFERLERRMNAAVIARCSNATATLNGVEVTGIFDDAYREADVGGMGMASSEPVFTALTANVPTNVIGATLTVRGTTYLVAEHKPDGTGMSRLFLESAL